MFDAFDAMIAQGLQVNGEYYVSMAYKVLLQSHQPVAVYPIQYFIQWGTPQDLAEYCRWWAAFEWLSQDRPRPPRQDGAVLVPMAGLGSRFRDKGYALPKPLIPVSGRAVAVQAAADLPHAPRTCFVVRSDLQALETVSAAICSGIDGGDIVELEALTDGQARTCTLAIESGHRTAGATDHRRLRQRHAV